jgi:hypothetical protein
MIVIVIVLIVCSWSFDIPAQTSCWSPGCVNLLHATPSFSMVIFDNFYIVLDAKNQSKNATKITE